jgi:hypothetical protein
MVIESSLSAAGRDMSPPLSGRNTTLSRRQKCFSEEARSKHVLLYLIKVPSSRHLYEKLSPISEMF